MEKKSHLNFAMTKHLLYYSARMHSIDLQINGSPIPNLEKMCFQKY